MKMSFPPLFFQETYLEKLTIYYYTVIRQLMGIIILSIFVLGHKELINKLNSYTLIFIVVLALHCFIGISFKLIA